MTTIHLTQSTGHPMADRVVQDIVTRFETSFPNQIIGYYVEGSYADQTAVPTSDLDLLIVLRQALASAEDKAQAERVLADCQQESAMELDLTLTDAIYLRDHADPMFKIGARLLYGVEIRDTIPLIPIASWARQRMHAAYWLMINIFQRPKPVYAPLSFPEPTTVFYGYTNRTMRLADGSTIPTMRNLIRVIGWIATARIAYQAQHYVVRKRDCTVTYRQTINDEWTGLLEKIDQRCRSAWHYRIPVSLAEQAELNTIVTQTLAFENHFLMLYRNFLLTELTGTDQAAQLDALRLLHNTFFADPAIIAAVKQLLSSADPAVQKAAQQLEP